MIFQGPARDIGLSTFLQKARTFMFTFRRGKWGVYKVQAYPKV